MMLRNTALTILAASLLAVTGCGGGSTEETSAAGRTATVEFRPAVVGLDKTIQKQRSGKLIKVTTEWVVIDENGAEIWVPRDMVLEIRMGG